MLELYSFFNSSTSYRVRIALALKGLEYEYKAVNIRAGDEYQPQYTEVNPSKGVPVLVDGDLTITQSMAIMQYLDEQYPEPRLIPEDLINKTRVLELCNGIACDIHPVNNLRILNYLTNELNVSPEDKALWYQHWIQQGLEATETLLHRYGRGDFCFGDVPGLADCCLVPQVANALRMKCDLQAFPRVMSAYDRCLQLPAFRQAAPENQPDYMA
jgi:maleylacetoacetate isomerase